MTDLEFERLLSFKPRDDFRVPQPCLRDLVFDHFEEAFNATEADVLTKIYIKQLWEHVRARKA